MNMWKKFPYEIRWAEEKDWSATMNMIWRTFLRFEAGDYTSEGIANFKDFITDDHLYQMFLNGAYPMLVALDEGKIIGQISVRNGNHISLLFVDEAYHKKGIGRELVKRMAVFLKKERHQLFMTVQAAPYAVGFYRRVGFRANAPEEEYSGIRVTSMEKFL
ncbi:MAG: GNAT family N-acetyltransferase [Lachnospiraceae bacterium]